MFGSDAAIRLARIPLVHGAGACRRDTKQQALSPKTAWSRPRALYFGHASYARIGGSWHAGHEGAVKKIPAAPAASRWIPVTALAFRAVGLVLTPVELLAVLKWFPCSFGCSCKLTDSPQSAFRQMYISSSRWAPCRLHLTAASLRQLGTSSCSLSTSQHRHHTPPRPHPPCNAALATHTHTPWRATPDMHRHMPPVQPSAPRPIPTRTGPRSQIWLSDAGYRTGSHR